MNVTDGDRQPRTPVRESLLRVPPPAAFALSIAAGAWIGRRIPLPIVPEAAAGIARSLGGGLMALGVGLAGVCLAQFLGRRTTVVPHRGASALVTGGPYRLTRNPMYVALTSIGVGVALFANLLCPLLLLPVPLWLVATVHVPAEEAMLRAAFGEEYRQYASRVPRWPF
jgi:protein-S-isoprenylcysteine O-methyltransferase Ste14